MWMMYIFVVSIFLDIFYQALYACDLPPGFNKAAKDTAMCWVGLNYLPLVTDVIAGLDTPYYLIEALIPISPLHLALT